MKVGYWLIPSAPHKARFEHLIRKLAANYDAPVFEPHVTLYSGEVTAESHIANIVEQAALGIEPFALTPGAVETSGEFTRTLFLTFQSSDTLQQLSDKMKTMSGGTSDYLFQPHLSLLYADLPESERVALSSTVHFTTDEVLFNEIKVIALPPVTRSRRDVEAWRTVYAYEL